MIQPKRSSVMNPPVHIMCLSGILTECFKTWFESEQSNLANSIDKFKGRTKLRPSLFKIAWRVTNANN